MNPSPFPVGDIIVTYPTRHRFNQTFSEMTCDILALMASRGCFTPSPEGSGRTV